MPQPMTLMSIAAVLAIVALLVLAVRYVSMRATFEQRVREEFGQWRDRELAQMTKQIETLARKEWEMAFEQWKTVHTEDVRKDAVQRSAATMRGQMFEQVVPYLPDFRFNPKDARFLGSPVDFVVFDGLSDSEVGRVVFVEVKTGSATLTPRERRVRDAVRAGRVDWEEIHLRGEPIELPPAVAGRARGTLFGLLTRWRSKPEA